MRLTPPRLEDYRVVTPDFVRRASTLASICSTALFRAVVVSAWIIGCFTYPSAHADTIYGTGSYTVPDQLPYGIYIAHADRRRLDRFAHTATPTQNPCVNGAVRVIGL